MNREDKDDAVTVLALYQANTELSTVSDPTYVRIYRESEKMIDELLKHFELRKL